MRRPGRSSRDTELISIFIPRHDERPLESTSAFGGSSAIDSSGSPVPLRDARQQDVDSKIEKASQVTRTLPAGLLLCDQSDGKNKG